MFLLRPPEKFIENVVKNVGRQHLNVDNLTPQDLDQLSSLIADALLVVDQDPGLDRGLSRDRGLGLRDLEEEQSDSNEEEDEKLLLKSAPTLKPQDSPSVSLTAPQGTSGMTHFALFCLIKP